MPAGTPRSPDRSRFRRVVDRLLERRDRFYPGPGARGEDRPNASNRYHSSTALFRLRAAARSGQLGRHRDLHLVVPPTDGADLSARLDKSLIKAISRAVTWYDDLVSGRAASMQEIATTENVSERYVAQLLPLALLDPSSIEDCLDGSVDMQIAGSDLARGITIPREWQR